MRSIKAMELARKLAFPEDIKKLVVRQPVKATPATPVSYNSSDHKPAAIETLTVQERDMVNWHVNTQGWSQTDALRDVAMRRAIAAKAQTRR